MAAPSGLQTRTVRVPYLNARVGYATSYPSSGPDPSKPTVVLINSLCTTAALYAPQLSNARLAAATNLIAVETLGHGETTALASCQGEQEEEEEDVHFTYWDSARVALQALDKLNVTKAYVLGTSQGGWIAVRMALLAPERILGLVTLGTSMDCESSESRQKGSWDPSPFVTPFLEKWRGATATPDFVVDDNWIQPVITLGFGSAATPATVEYWTDSMRRIYSGDNGRRKVRLLTICLAERDGLLYRLGDIKCPIHWLQGLEDPVFGSTIPQEHIKLFTASPSAKLDIIDGGAHLLTATHPEEVEAAILEMVANS
ncbi:putative alpha/beta hydrolase [Durotheca rogersii]|uniref:putative alpha/beta hydrolase n=1 Tax=Durotheca rogersii TaxID=419775 RepID=UPI00221F99D0|nr:putative alpha/beta hydrolase [Durotheca rogersii]KAI5863692.1 putative alpha/beta hydrolase [Durotheca rogersii]